MALHGLPRRCAALAARSPQRLHSADRAGGTGLAAGTSSIAGCHAPGNAAGARVLAEGSLVRAREQVLSGRGAGRRPGAQHVCRFT